VPRGAIFFVTVCCQRRGENQLCRKDVAQALIDTARFYHEREDWFARLILIMPDHVHGLVSPAPDKQIGRMIGDWKRFAAKRHGIEWQKNFVDHRLRSDESWEEKANYIRMNPVRAGLIRAGEAWPYMIEN
jgi:REP element-mobilizing transposase RayT